MRGKIIFFRGGVDHVLFADVPKRLVCTLVCFLCLFASFGCLLMRGMLSISEAKLWIEIIGARKLNMI